MNAAMQGLLSQHRQFAGKVVASSDRSGAGRFEGSGDRWLALMSTPEDNAADPRHWQRGCTAPTHSQGPTSCPQHLVSGSRSILPPGWLSRGPASPFRSHPGPGHPGTRPAHVQTHQGALETALPKAFCLVSGLLWGQGLGAWIHRRRGVAGMEAAPLWAPCSQPLATLVWGPAPGVDAELGARPPGQPSSPSSQRPAPSSSSSPGCQPSLRRPSPAPR